MRGHEAGVVHGMEVRVGQVLRVRARGKGCEGAKTKAKSYKKVLKLWRVTSSAKVLKLRLRLTSGMRVRARA